MKEKETIIMLFVFLIILGIVGTITYKTWTIGNTGKDYDIVCIGGHEYYRANFANKGFLGIRLNSDGKPINCGEIK